MIATDAQVRKLMEQLKKEVFFSPLRPRSPALTSTESLVKKAEAEKPARLEEACSPLSLRLPSKQASLRSDREAQVKH